MATIAAGPAVHHRPWYRHLYVQVLCAIAIGVLVGYLAPKTGEQLKPLGDAFVALIKMLIAPIIFCTVVHGIAGMEDMKKVGRVGLKALVYFEVMTTVALIIGLIVVNLWRPGAGMNVDPASLDTKAIATYTAQAQQQTVIGSLLHIIPNTFVSAFAEGEILQVLLLAILFAFSLHALGERGRPLLSLIDQVAHVIFGMVRIVMYVAPIGAFGAMAFTVGKYGVGTLLSLGQLMGSVYVTCLLFIFVVLGIVCALCGFSILKFIRYIREELLIVLGTSSSEAVLPRMLAKMENLGCDRSVVGLVIPGGYSFNLDGTCIYLTMAAVFLAQATNTPLDLEHQIALIGILLLTSKGAAGVTGSGFIVLAATLASVGTVPVAAMALILGVDRFMSEARALTNLIGNGVATVVVARWEGELDEARLHQHLDQETEAEADDPTAVLADQELARTGRA
jgi:aerobic C4-dicarboxylate transport protein